MKGGLTCEDNVTWKNGDVAPVFIVNEAAVKINKEKEEAIEDSTAEAISLRQIICLLGVIVVFLLSVTGTAIMWGTNMLEDMVDQRLLLKKGSESYEKWVNPPMPMFIRYRLFNYTNVEAFELGEEPRLKVQEVGPFVFRETKKRVNVVFNGNGTVTYQTKLSFQFLPEQSAASLEDHIVSINLPLMTMHYRATKELYYLQRFAASLALKHTGVRPFITRTARELFYGYKDMLIALAELSAPDIKVGILQDKMGISPDKITMYTGETDVNLVGMISHYNGLEHMDYYSDPECNRVDGGDGSKFPPSSIYPNSTLYVYERDACRRIPLTYREDVKIWDDMPLMRYSPQDDVFYNGEANPENQCYCEERCQLSGVTGISHCKQGAPIFASFPHFINSDPALVEAVDGLKPDVEKHASYLDIHQRIGAPLKIKLRTQGNMLMTNGLMQDILEKLDGTILPTFWMEREMGEFPDDVRAIIEEITFTLPAVKMVLSYTCPLLVVITGIVLLICIYIEVAAIVRKDPPKHAASVTCITRL